MSSILTACSEVQRVHCCSVTHFPPALSNPMDGSTPGFPVLHRLLEFAQTHPSLQPSVADLPADANGRLLETFSESNNSLLLSAGPPSAGDVMTMVALATAGRRRAARAIALPSERLGGKARAWLAWF